MPRMRTSSGKCAPKRQNTQNSKSHHSKRKASIHKKQHRLNHTATQQQDPPSLQNRKTKVLVLGGGISGYTLAFTIQQGLRKRGLRSVDITLVDKNDKPGGWIRTSQYPYTVETGPRSLLLKPGQKDYSPDDRVRWVLRTAGLESELITPSKTSERKFIYRDGKFNNAMAITEVKGPIVRNLHSIIHFALGKRRGIKTLSKLLPNSIEYQDNIILSNNNNNNDDDDDDLNNNTITKNQHPGAQHDLIYNNLTIPQSQLLKVPTTDEIDVNPHALTNFQIQTPSLQHYDINRAVYGDTVMNNMQRDAVVYGYSLNTDGTAQTPYYYKQRDILHPDSLSFTKDQLLLSSININQDATPTQPKKGNNNNTTPMSPLTPQQTQAEVIQTIKQYKLLNKKTFAKKNRVLIKKVNYLFNQSIQKHKDMLTIFIKNRDRLINQIFIQQSKKLKHFGFDEEKDDNGLVAELHSITSTLQHNNLKSAHDILPTIKQPLDGEPHWENDSTPIHNYLNINNIPNDNNPEQLQPQQTHENSTTHILQYSLDNTVTTYQQLAHIHQEEQQRMLRLKKQEEQEQPKQTKDETQDKQKEENDENNINNTNQNNNNNNNPDLLISNDIVSKMIDDINANFSPEGIQHKANLAKYGLPEDMIKNARGLQIDEVGDDVVSKQNQSNNTNDNNTFTFPSLQKHDIYQFTPTDTVYLHDLGRGGYAQENDMTYGTEYSHSTHNIKQSTDKLFDLEHKLLHPEQHKDMKRHVKDLENKDIDKKTLKKELLLQNFILNGIKNKKPFLIIPNTIIASHFSRVLIKNKMPLDQFGQRDESVGEFMSREVSGNFVQELIDPMIAGIYSGNPYTISMSAAFPDIINAELKKSHFYPYFSTSIKLLFNQLHQNWLYKIQNNYINNKLYNNLIKKNLQCIKFDRVKSQQFHPYYIFPNSPMMHQTNELTWTKHWDMFKFRKKYTSITFFNGMQSLPTHLHNFITNIHNRHFFRDGMNRLIETGPFTHHSILIEDVGAVTTRVLQNTNVLYMRSNTDINLLLKYLTPLSTSISSDNNTNNKNTTNSNSSSSLSNNNNTNDIIDTEHISSINNNTDNALIINNENNKQDNNEEHILDITLEHSTYDDKIKAETDVNIDTLNALRNDGFDHLRPVLIGLVQDNYKNKIKINNNKRNNDNNDNQYEYAEQHAFDYVFSCIDSYQLAKIIDHPLSHVNDVFLHKAFDKLFIENNNNNNNQDDNTDDENNKHKLNNKLKNKNKNKLSSFVPNTDKFMYLDQQRNVVRIHLPTLNRVLDNLVMQQRKVINSSLSSSSDFETSNNKQQQQQKEQYQYLSLPAPLRTGGGGSGGKDSVASQPAQHFQVRNAKGEDTSDLFHQVKQVYLKQLGITNLDGIKDNNITTGENNDNNSNYDDNGNIFESNNENNNNMKKVKTSIPIEEKSVLDDDYEDYLKEKLEEEKQRQAEKDFFTVHTLHLNDIYNYSLNYHAQRSLSLLQSMNTVNQSILLSIQQNKNKFNNIDNNNNTNNNNNGNNQHHHHQHDTFQDDFNQRVPHYITQYLDKYKNQLTTSILDHKYYNTYRVSIPISFWGDNTTTNTTSNTNTTIKHNNNNINNNTSNIINVNPLDQILLCRCGYWSNELPVDLGVDGTSFCTVNHTITDPFMSLQKQQLHFEQEQQQIFSSSSSSSSELATTTSYNAYHNAIIYPRVYTDGQHSLMKLDEKHHNQQSSIEQSSSSIDQSLLLQPWDDELHEEYKSKVKLLPQYYSSHLIKFTQDLIDKTYKEYILSYDIKDIEQKVETFIQKHSKDDSIISKIDKNTLKVSFMANSLSRRLLQPQHTLKSSQDDMIQQLRDVLWSKKINIDNNINNNNTNSSNDNNSNNIVSSSSPLLSPSTQMVHNLTNNIPYYIPLTAKVLPYILQQRFIAESKHAKYLSQLKHKYSNTHTDNNNNNNKTNINQNKVKTNIQNQDDENITKSISKSDNKNDDNDNINTNNTNIKPTTNDKIQYNLKQQIIKHRKIIQYINQNVVDKLDKKLTEYQTNHEMYTNLLFQWGDVQIHFAHNNIEEKVNNINKDIINSEENSNNNNNKKNNKNLGQDDSITLQTMQEFITPYYQKNTIDMESLQQHVSNIKTKYINKYNDMLTLLLQLEQQCDDNINLIQNIENNNQNDNNQNDNNEFMKQYQRIKMLLNKLDDQQQYINLLDDLNTIMLKECNIKLNNNSLLKEINPITTTNGDNNSTINFIDKPIYVDNTIEFKQNNFIPNNNLNQNMFAKHFKTNNNILPLLGNTTLSSISTALHSFEMSSMTLFNMVFDEDDENNLKLHQTGNSILTKTKGFGALVPTYTHLQDFYENQQKQKQQNQQQNLNNNNNNTQPQLYGLLGVCFDSDTFPELYATSMSAHSHLKHAALSNNFSHDVLYGPYRNTTTSTAYKDALLNNNKDVINKLYQNKNNNNINNNTTNNSEQQQQPLPKHNQYERMPTLKTMTFMAGGARYPDFIQNSHVDNVKNLYTWCQKLFITNNNNHNNNNNQNNNINVKPKYIRITKQYHCIPQPSIGIHALSTAIQNDINTHYGYYLRTPVTATKTNTTANKHDNINNPKIAAHAPHTIVWGDTNISTTSTNTSYTGNVTNDIYTGQGLIWPVVSICGTITNNPSLKFLMSNSVNVGMSFAKHIDI